MYYDQKESGKRIAALRKEKGMTQEQLAEKLNISTSTLGKIERGIQGFSIDLLIEIGIFFGISTDYIWTSIMIKCELMILRNYQARGMRIIPIEPMITKLQSRLCLRDWGYRIYLAETANLHQKKKNSGCCSTGYM